MGASPPIHSISSGLGEAAGAWVRLRKILDPPALKEDAKLNTG
jgi:hypothetical protein